MRVFFALFFLVILISGCKFGDAEKEDNPDAQEGFQIISNDGNAHFLYLDEKYWGDKMKQIVVGQRLCTNVFKQKDYCEVYYFSSKTDIPTKFPILGRLNPVGVYESKYGDRRLKLLPGGKNNEYSGVTFYKNREKKKSIWGGEEIIDSAGGGD